MVADCLIVKNGLFYRANACGYTARLAEAGFFTEDQAVAEHANEPASIIIRRAGDMVAEFDEVIVELEGQLSRIRAARANFNRVTETANTQETTYARAAISRTSSRSERRLHSASLRHRPSPVASDPSGLGARG